MKLRRGTDIDLISRKEEENREHCRRCERDKCPCPYINVQYKCMSEKKRKRKGERESESWRNCLEQTRKVYAKDVDGGFNIVYGINDMCDRRVRTIVAVPKTLP